MPSYETTNAPWRDRLGMPEAQCKGLIAIISGYEVYGKPVLSSDAGRFLIEIDELRTATCIFGELAKRGWIKAVGKVVCANAYDPTARGYAILGLERKRPLRAA